MSFSLVNAQTTDSFDDVVLACPGSATVTITVSNAGALVQYGHGIPPTNWEPGAGEPLVPSLYSSDRPFDGVRVKSMAAGDPAVVSIVARTAQEISGG